MLRKCWHNFLFYFLKQKTISIFYFQSSSKKISTGRSKVKDPLWVGLAQSVGLGMDRNPYRLALESNAFKGYGVLHFLLLFFFFLRQLHCLCLFLSSPLSYIDGFGHNFFTSFFIKRNRHVAYGYSLVYLDFVTLYRFIPT